MPRSKKTQPAPKAVTTDLLEKYKDFPGIKVVERFMENPDSGGMPDIRLVGEASFRDDPLGKKRVWTKRWVDTTMPGRWATVVDRLGYAPVKMEQLQDPEGIAGLAQSHDGYVRMGDKGKEILVYQPLELYTARKKALRDRRDRRVLNRKLVKEDLANAAARGLGDESADLIDRELTVDVMTRHRTTLGQELDARD